MFTLPSKKTILAALPLIASAGAVPCVQFDAEWSLYAFGGSEDVKLGGSGSWGCRTLRNHYRRQGRGMLISST